MASELVGQSTEAALETSHATCDLQWERAQLAAARKGNRDAFAALYDAFAPRLYSTVLLPRLSDADAAQDALSETFQALYKNLAALDMRNNNSLWSWLATVARNKATDIHRQRHRHQALAKSFEGFWALVARQQASMHDRLEVAQAIERCLEALNPRYALAIELRFISTKSRQECAKALQVELGTFDVVLLRAVRAFRREWTKLFDETGAD